MAFPHVSGTGPTARGQSKLLRGTHTWRKTVPLNSGHTDRRKCINRASDQLALDPVIASSPSLRTMCVTNNFLGSHWTLAEEAQRIAPGVGKLAVVHGRAEARRAVSSQVRQTSETPSWSVYDSPSDRHYVWARTWLDCSWNFHISHNLSLKAACQMIFLFGWLSFRPFLWRRVLPPAVF